MYIHGTVLAGACCASFVGGVLVGAAILFFVHLRRRPQARDLGSISQAHPPSLPPDNTRVPTKINWWRPQPEDFAVKEHNILEGPDTDLLRTRYQQLLSTISSFVLEVRWKNLSASRIQTLTSDAFTTVLTQHGYGEASLSALPNRCSIAALMTRAETRESGLTHLLALLAISNIVVSVDGSGGPAEWNLLSPHLAGLAQEIFDRRRREDASTRDDFVVWAWEKLRIYALINLYPGIFLTSVWEHQNSQPTTNVHALARLEKLLVDLLVPYLEIGKDETEVLQSILRQAGRLGVGVHTILQPWGWSWETQNEGIPLFPAFGVFGDDSGIRSQDHRKVIELSYDPSYNLAGERLDGAKTVSSGNRQL